MKQTIMQGPSVCPYFATRSLSSGLVGSGDSKKNAGGKINETSNGVVLFVGIHQVSMLTKNLALCDLHTDSYRIVMVLSK